MMTIQFHIDSSDPAAVCFACLPAKHNEQAERGLVFWRALLNIWRSYSRAEVKECPAKKRADWQWNTT